MEVIQHSQTFLTDDDIAAAVSVLKSGIINDSDVTTRFEREFAGYIGARWARATSTGTLALYLALRALDIKAGTEVILPAYVCDDVLSAIRLAGATPRLADICLEDFNIDPVETSRKVSKRTGAIICPHMFGMPARLDELLKLNMPVIEDCANSIGATYQGKRVGALGMLSCFSFQALKILTTGEGGMVVTSNPELWERLEHYDSPDLDAGEFALTFHLSNILSAIGLSQLRHFEASLVRRQQIAETYQEGLQGLGLVLPKQWTLDRTSSSLRYCVMIREDYGVDEVCEAFASKGIIVRRPVKRVLHNIRGLEQDYCPNSQFAYDHVISLPAHLRITPEDQVKIIEVAQRIFSDGR
jgi:dTDP-4-amino-4,6-dideoxygalactose transaminase